jgi:hypothetical protein
MADSTTTKKSKKRKDGKKRTENYTSFNRH